ncbi:MAG: hypothetical protein Q9191_002963 [Dirinaria sp. TL-2023a]
MRPKLHLFSPRQYSAVRARVPRYQAPLPLHIASRRYITADEKPLPKAEEGEAGPNETQLPHVSEEAAATGEITGEGGPEIEEQGTPVQEILDRDEESKDKAPEVMKRGLQNKPLDGTRSFSTYARRRAELAVTEARDSDIEQDVEQDVEQKGHIFDLPSLPLPSNANIKHRFDPVVQQVTALIMRDGKLALAQRNMATILNQLRTASPPTVNPTRPLVHGAPPASHLPLNPALYMTVAIDSVAPLFRIRAVKGVAGGGMALQVPAPLSTKQRRRRAFMWILDAASKRRTRGSGRDGFAQKIAEEIVAVVEGRSGVWDRKGGVHKLGVSSRANINFKRFTGRR